MTTEAIHCPNRCESSRMLDAEYGFYGPAKCDWCYEKDEPTSMGSPGKLELAGSDESKQGQAGV